MKNGVKMASSYSTEALIYISEGGEITNLHHKVCPYCRHQIFLSPNEFWEHGHLCESCEHEAYFVDIGGEG